MKNEYLFLNIILLLKEWFQSNPKPAEFIFIYWLLKMVAALYFSESGSLFKIHVLRAWIQKGMPFICLLLHY